MLIFTASYALAARVPTVTEEVAPPAPTGFHVAAELFDDDAIPAFDLELSDASLQALRLEPYAWTEGALVYRGVRLEPVAVRLTGDHEVDPIDLKPSLRIDLDRYAPLELLGLHELTLHSLTNDESMMAERIAYRLFREHGLPASRANHATVRISGEDRGLYGLVEAVDRDLLVLWQLDPGGSLWELSDGEFDPAWLDGFDPVSGSDDPVTLQAITDALSVPGGDPIAATAQWIDWDHLVDWFAATVVVGQFDGYPWHSPGDDAYLYFDAANGRMTLLPHALDETFRHEDHGPWSGPGLLLQACAEAPACAADYIASIWDAQATAEAIDLAQYARDVQARIAPLVKADPARPYTVDEIGAAQEDLVAFIAERQADLSALLGGQ